MSNRDGHDPKISILDGICLAVGLQIFLDIVKPIARKKLDEWRERREYLRSEEGLRERVDAMEPAIKARAYAAKKNFDALVKAGFTPEQAAQIILK